MAREVTDEIEAVTQSALVDIFGEGLEATDVLLHSLPDMVVLAPSVQIWREDDYPCSDGPHILESRGRVGEWLDRAGQLWLHQQKNPRGEGKTDSSLPTI